MGHPVCRLVVSSTIICTSKRSAPLPRRYPEINPGLYLTRSQRSLVGRIFTEVSIE